ncbi:MAG: hypothetical protein M3Z32_00630 [Acidobacteriota bacterium]|nr:hypothetical protein [Acidobacteriota bacterium]
MFARTVQRGQSRAFAGQLGRAEDSRGRTCPTQVKALQGGGLDANFVPPPEIRHCGCCCVIAWSLLQQRQQTRIGIGGNL